MNLSMTRTTAPFRRCVFCLKKQMRKRWWAELRLIWRRMPVWSSCGYLSLSWFQRAQKNCSPSGVRAQWKGRCHASPAQAPFQQLIWAITIDDPVLELRSVTSISISLSVKPHCDAIVTCLTLSTSQAIGYLIFSKKSSAVDRFNFTQLSGSEKENLTPCLCAQPKRPPCRQAAILGVLTSPIFSYHLLMQPRAKSESNSKSKTRASSL